MLTLSEPKIIEREPYNVVGSYCTYEGQDEGPGWTGADQEFNRRRAEVTNTKGDLTLGFMYRPHRDHPDIPEDVHACFVGVEVSDLDHVPEGMSTTRFSGGLYAVVACQGDDGGESAMGVGDAINYLETEWLAKNGYTEGDACFAASETHAQRPPYVEYVYMKLEKKP